MRSGDDGMALRSAGEAIGDVRSEPREVAGEGMNDKREGMSGE